MLSNYLIKKVVSSVKLLFFYLFLTSSILSQTDDDGPYTLYHENGSIKEQGFYLDGKKHGYRIVYYNNDRIEKEGNWKNGNPHGEFTWYSNTWKNSVEVIRTYNNGVLEGIEKMYWDDGSIMSIYYYKNGKKNGPVTLFRENIISKKGMDGSIVFYGFMKDDLEHGKWIMLGPKNHTGHQDTMAISTYDQGVVMNEEYFGAYGEFMDALKAMEE